MCLYACRGLLCRLVWCLLAKVYKARFLSSPKDSFKVIATDLSMYVRYSVTFYKTRLNGFMLKAVKSDNGLDQSVCYINKVCKLITGIKQFAC